MLIIFPSGSNYCFNKSCGIFFWGVHGFDGIWHLAISNVSFNSFPFKAPTYFGAQMSGYNYLFDLIIHSLSLLGIPAIITYFKIFPVIWFLIFTSLLIILARKIKDTPLFISLFLFFSYFAGSFSYFFTLARDHNIWGSSSLLSTLVVHTMSNLQFAFSLLILLTVLVIIKDQKPSFKNIFILSILNFINIGIKFYGGAITSFIILFYICISLNKKTISNTLKYVFIFGVLSVLSIIFFYDPFSSIKSGAIFSFAPFALIHPITEDPSLFYNQKLTNARYFLLTKGIGPRLILIECFNLLAFLLFYLGVRFLAFFYIVKQILKRNFDRFNYILLGTSLFAITLSSLLVQKGEWWNVIQFFFYVIFILTIFLSQLTEEMFNSKHIIIKFFAILILVLAIPTTIDVIKQYAVFPGSSYIPTQELSALQFLKNQPNGIVLTAPYDKTLRFSEGLNDLYRAEDSAYVSAFTGKQSYLASFHPLGLMGINIDKRLALIKNNDCGILPKINYIYEIHSNPASKAFVGCKNIFIQNIFANDAVTIFKVKH